MKINFNYGNKVRTIPGTISNKLLLKASKNQLIVLIHLSNKDNVDIVKDSSILNMSIDDFVCALNFWKDNNIISFEAHDASNNLDKSSEKSSLKEEKNNITLNPSNEFPTFTKKEISDIINNNPNTKSLIDCCQQTLGKVFNSAEINIIVGMLDYLQLKPEYILLLCDYCVKLDKKSLRYIEKLAIEFVEKGITDYSELENYIESKRKVSNLTVDIQKALGITDRLPVPIENQCFEKWICSWNLNIEIIQKAYEICIVNTGKYSIKYIDKILENWHGLGLNNIASIENYINESSSTRNTVKSSFDTNDFFGAALNRTYKKGDK